MGNCTHINFSSAKSEVTLYLKDVMRHDSLHLPALQREIHLSCIMTCTVGISYYNALIAMTNSETTKIRNLQLHIYIS